ncbi:MAG: alpha/beta fold hydrolase [Alphaproteobacteria bacterium]|nr:alpha/beta fold hydrolase [Alphaproteobacteria bacterium]
MQASRPADLAGSAIRKGYVDLSFGQMHWRSVAGADPSLPVMLLLHQSPLSARHYDSLLPLLAGRVQPFALDTPGYGGSDPAPAGWEIADYARAVLAAADALGAARFHLFGRATGAVIAATAAALAPGRCLSVILHGLAVYTPEERRWHLDGYAPPFALAEDGSHLGWIWARIRHDYPWLSPAMKTAFARDYLAAGPDYATAYRAMWRQDLAAALASGIGAPTLLVGCDRDRIAEMHPRAVALLPGAEAVMLANATQYIAEEEPERFATLLGGFLDRATEGGTGT